jgi:hypothetical protein
VQFSSSDNQADLPDSYTFTGDEGGTHTFSTTLKTAGTQSITLTDDSGVQATSSGVLVTPGAAVDFNVVVQPNPVTAGNTSFVFVSAVDAFGNKGAVYTGTITFSSSDTSASLPADYKFTSADKGIQVFKAVFKARGTQTLTVKDSLDDTITGEQDDIQVV